MEVSVLCGGVRCMEESIVRRGPLYGGGVRCMEGSMNGGSVVWRRGTLYRGVHCMEEWSVWGQRGPLYGGGRCVEGSVVWRGLIKV